MRLYLDTNIYAHAQEVDQESELTDWLRQSGHRVVLSDTLLGEAIAIRDVALRMQRLALWAGLRSVTAGSLGELQAREFVNEVRRLRPGWRRLPVGDESTIAGLRAARRKGWRLLRDDPERSVLAMGDYQQVEERGIQGAQAGQRTIRTDSVEKRTRIEAITLGSTRIPIRRLKLDAEDDFCRLESLFSWYQAMFEGSETLSEYSAYAEPYLRLQSVTEQEFADFWLNEVDLGRMRSGWATSLVNFAQIQRKIQRGNSGDARHAGHLLDAELMITEDRSFYAALEFVAPRIADAAQPRLLDRGTPDLVSQLAAAVT